MMRSMLVGALVLMACGGEVEVESEPGELGGEGGALVTATDGGAGGEGGAGGAAAEPACETDDDCGACERCGWPLATACLPIDDCAER